MRVLILGATGSIGSVVTDELISNGYSILALARSDKSEETLKAKGASVIRGDIIHPDPWRHAIHDVDAIIHVATTFGDDMGDVDRRLIHSLIEEGKSLERKLRFIFTGGCWLYGATGDTVAIEESPFNPMPVFSWMVENAKAIINADCFEGIVIHPAMVYHRDGGVITRYLDSAEENGRIETWGSPDTRWPVVHQLDLAVAYRLALEKGMPGEHYNIAAEEGVPVFAMADAIARRYGLETDHVERGVAGLIEEHGEWAEGPTLDQQMSGEKAKRDLGWQPTYTGMIAEIG